MERVRHYSINGWTHIADFVEVRGGWGEGGEGGHRYVTLCNVNMQTSLPVQCVWQTW